MAGKVQYRHGRREDLPAVAEVFLAAFPESVEHYVGRPVLPLIMVDAFAICLDTEPEGFFVAEEDGEVVGYIFGPRQFSRLYRTAIWQGHLWRMFRRWISGQYGVGVKPFLVAARNQLFVWREARSRRSVCDARIFSIAVHPDHQSRRIGTGLLEVSLNYLDGCGGGRVCLEVRADSSSAQRLYEKFGFRVSGRSRDTRGDWLVMVRDVTGDAAK